jgi:hypothetical protein
MCRDVGTVSKLKEKICPATSENIHVPKCILAILLKFKSGYICACVKNIKYFSK